MPIDALDKNPTISPKPPEKKDVSTPKNNKEKFFPTLKDKIASIFASRDDKNPRETLQEISLLETVKESDKSQNNTNPDFDPNFFQKIRDRQEAQKLSQQIKSEAAKYSENQPIIKTLFPRQPSLYEQYHQKYKKERKTIRGTINRSANIRRLQKEGLSKSDAKEIYDSLRFRGVPDFLIKIKGYRVGGDATTSINARKNGSSNHLATAKTLASASTWIDAGTVQNTNYAVGDSLEIMVVVPGASLTQIAIQVDFIKLLT